MKTKLEHYPVTRANFGFIHNDIHPKNILLSPSAMHLIDFDRSCRHFFVQDIANAIYSEYSRIGFHSKHKAALADMLKLFVKPFIESYIETYPTLAEDLIALEQFIMYRRIVMFAIFHDEVKAAAPAYLEEFRQGIVQNTKFLPFDTSDLL
ncbi:MAG: phosphotransferase [Candidatus Cloacimonetes bacterium]|jgi:Ser/Thr protein kinase RdoA (MazF antagonist)|nr:phosphotransferase [Candidatus Cloacimonadota bacterium]MDD4560589.1 phosphotransferase [Candidatus Cloacimonadota bacterium]